MPRFTETEKANIRQKLILEGERLFAAHGLKKVTIDDLIEAANIAKATFYTFYESKEYLYLDIVQGIQKEIFMKLETLLEGNIDLPGKERVKQVFIMMNQLMMQRPILSQIDTATVALISRKVSKERVAAYAQQNVDAAQSMKSHGIEFSCDIMTASCAFQALYYSWMFLQDKGSGIQTAVTDILLNGVIEQIVVE